MMNLDKVNRTNLFPTSAITYTWEDVEELNKELKEMIFKEIEKNPEGIKYSNVGGYHSTIDLLSWDYPCVKPFIDMIQAISQIMARNDGLKENSTVDLSLSAWANVIQSGHYHIAHRHPNNFWSGCYYIDSGDPDEGLEHNGFFEFMDPRPGANMHSNEDINFPRYQINPIPGLMTIFPAWVEHFVHPYVGSGKRVTISFNVRVVNK